MQEENAGKYECRVTSQNAQRSKFYTLAIKGMEINYYSEFKFRVYFDNNSRMT